VDFYKAMFESAVLTIPGVSACACQVRDWALADDAPARAVLALNSVGKGVVFGYAGFTWNGYIKNDGQTVHANVEAAIASHLHAAAKSGVQVIPDVWKLPQQHSAEKAGGTGQPEALRDSRQAPSNQAVCA
jgi:hypothetical protein